MSSERDVPVRATVQSVGRRGLPLGDDPNGFLAMHGLSLASAVPDFAVIRLLSIRPPSG